MRRGLGVELALEAVHLEHQLLRLLLSFLLRGAGHREVLAEGDSVFLMAEGAVLQRLGAVDKLREAGTQGCHLLTAFIGHLNLSVSISHKSD